MRQRPLVRPNGRFKNYAPNGATHSASSFRGELTRVLTAIASISAAGNGSSSATAISGTKVGNS